MNSIRIVLLASNILLVSCANFDLTRDYDSDTLITAASDELTLEPDQTWQATTPLNSGAVSANTEWYKDFNDVILNDYITAALRNNRNLRAEATRLAAVIESVNSTKSQRRPTVDGVLTQNYALPNGGSGDFTYNTSVNLSWELDVWSSLSDQNKSAALSAEASAANYRAAQLSLVANIASRWYDINADQLLLNISEKRLENQKNSLSIIEEQFKSGQGAAMDIFLNRSEVAEQGATIVSARNALEQSIRSFKRLLGVYPDIQLDFNAVLPELDASVPAGLPSDLLKRRPDVLASLKQWQVSILDAGIADKARYPSFALTASYGASSDELLQINASDLVFNLVNNLTLPLFRGGRLKSQLQQAELEAEANYHNYIDVLLTSFEEVESALGAENYLKEQLAFSEQALSFAQSAYELAFEQYQSGLIRYSNLLDFERTWFNAQSNVVALKNARLQNRINLHLALGGHF